MIHILRRLPFFDVETTATVEDETVVIRPYQIVVWVSLLPSEVTAPPRDMRKFLAVLDTGNNHNFSLRQSHLSRWASLELSALPGCGHIFLGAHKLPLVALNVWLHRNKPGERDAFARGKPFCLELEEGVAVYPHNTPSVARLPTLGLRAQADNGLRLTIDGKKRYVSLTA